MQYLIEPVPPRSGTAPDVRPSTKPSATSATQRDYTIGGVEDGRVLTASGATVAMARYAEADGQFWRFLSLGGGKFGILNSKSGMVLTVAGNSLEDGAPIVLAANTSALGQQWTLADGGNGWFTFRSVLSQKMLHLAGDQVVQRGDMGGAGVVTLYTGVSYSGTRQEVGIGRWALAGLTIGDDTLRSIRVPAGLQVTLYARDEFMGETRVLTSDTPDLGALSFATTTSSLIVQPASPEPPGPVVTLYSGESYSGESETFGVGTWSTSRIPRSIRVPAGLRVIRFSMAGVAGLTEVHTSDNPNFAGSFNTGSVQVQPVPSLLAQRWQLAAMMATTQGRTDPTITLWRDINFAGTSRKLGIGAWNISDLGSVGNDAVTSVTVPSGIKVTLFEHKDFGGSSKVLTASASSLDGFNDKTSSVIVEPAVTLFADDAFGGARQVLGVGAYDSADLTLGAGTVSSLCVPVGMMVTLYDGPGFTGSSRSFLEDAGSVGSDFNDKTRSVKVANLGVVVPRNVIAFGQTVQLVSIFGRFVRSGGAWPPVANAFTLVRSGPGKYGSILAYGDIVSFKAGSGYATLYTDSNYGGSFQHFGVGRWTLADFTIGNDKVSSLKVPVGLKVTIYQNDNFQGATKTFTGDTSYVGNDFNDKTSSVIVERTSTTEHYMVTGTFTLTASTSGEPGDDAKFEVIRSGPAAQGDVVAHGDTITLRSISENRYVEIGSDGRTLKSMQTQLSNHAYFVIKSRGAVGYAAQESAATTSCGVDVGGGGSELGACDVAACGAAACGADFCGADACGAAACGAAASLASACGVAVAGLAVCGADACGGAICGGAVCGGAAGGVSACGADVCSMAACGAAACGAAACGAAACGADACGTASSGASAHLANVCGSEAAIVDACPADACAIQACAVNLCPLNACAADFCGVDIIPIIPGI